MSIEHDGPRLPGQPELLAGEPGSRAAAPALIVRIRRGEYELHPGTTYSVGRDPGSDIVLTDSRVSWRHAVLRVDGGGWVIEDLHSTNGMFLGPQRLDRIEISADCVVRLGNPDDGPDLHFIPQPDAEPAMSGPEDRGPADEGSQAGGSAQPDGLGPGLLLAGYRLEARVGLGGMSAVWRARDERLGRPVALRIVAPGLASDTGFRQRFFAMTRAAARVSDPHVLPVYDAGEAGGVLFIAMRLVPGGDLRQVLARERPLPTSRAADLISQVASALDAAHAAGLVHGDVKPGNILVDKRPGRLDHVYLSDFGVSRAAVTGAGQFVGTVAYSAPEQVQGRAVDGRADQYALACVAYQLLTGTAPFERDELTAVLYAQLSAPPPSLMSRRPDLPAAADQVLARALAKAPEERYGSCGEFAAALRDALGLAAGPPGSHVAASAPSQPVVSASEPAPRGTVPAGPAPPGDRRGGDRAGVPGPRRRYLKGQCPESIAVGTPFSLLASIVLAGPASTGLKLFDVPPEGRDVLLVVHAPGLRLLGDQRLTVRVPAAEDSEPVMFELRADAPGPRSVSITAWLGGTYLGQLLVEITAERDRAPGPHREVLTEITTEPAEGTVSLVVRYDPVQNAYRFEFRDQDNPDEVHSDLAYDPAPLVEQLVADLDDLAKGRSGYSAAQARDYLMKAGARLWRQLVPAQLREQFWDRQHRIRQLVILADKDAVPWELLYPVDPGHDAGFLVEQFPVTRAIFGWRPVRTLRLRPARFVLPEGSLPEARHEIDAMRQLLDPGQPPGEVISALTPLTELIDSGDFGLLHFACHNTYDPARGCSIRLGGVPFTPTLLEIAVIRKALQRSGPTVFINACRSAGLAATYNRLDGWAGKFLEAGAAAFIGSLWAVSDGAAREFAQELYGTLRTGSSLGTAVMQARKVAASQADDPTWLAYTTYGDPRATISR